jgi:hypothetical protein
MGDSLDRISINLLAPLRVIYMEFLNLHLVLKRGRLQRDQYCAPDVKVASSFELAVGRYIFVKMV